MNLIQIVEVKGKLKAKVFGTFYYIRFPKKLMVEAGKFFVVEELLDLGNRMVAKGAIKPLDNKKLWVKALNEYMFFKEIPKEFLTDDVIIGVLKKRDTRKDLFSLIEQTAQYSSNKDAINQLSKKQIIMKSL